MRLKFLVIVILFSLILVIPAPAITVKDTRPFHFEIRAPRAISLNKPFKATIVAYDNRNRLVRDYNKIGNDLSITTTGTGFIIPTIVPASNFKGGKAVVYFTYDKGEAFDMVATPLERKLLQGGYRISDGDVLEISVWEAEGLTKEVIVTPDGMISFPLIGEMKAQGRTLNELDNEVTEKIKAYVRNPQVSIMVKKIGGKRVIVMGEVRLPGVYQVTGQGTVVEAVAMAGGTTAEAITRSVAVVRGDLTTSPAVRILNLDQIFTYGAIPADCLVQPGDIIYVPRQFIASVELFVRKILPEYNLIYGKPFFISK